ncbi:lipid-A-disaccharide synthase [Jannaschia sp. CCS1]|uniref:lipid-A-disaccharide synthase n=1 Tax=Jannaschia sp. (strain CCS1) TaxID=290400 RepID=UPI000053D95E|nr:lipid-A-disaccharide synthase [Jannaschia sp. CCS1]ABD55365.1 lipid-A-disaccharide synthase [Jannaschia sp. CCS1]
MTTLFLVAGEPSGDSLGASLMDGFDGIGEDVTFAGVGGPKMASRGLHSLFPYEELAVMGIAEVLPKYRALRRRITQTAQAFLESGAEALITIDSPDFGLRVARIVKGARPEAKTIHYVAPSVWAWRPKRAQKMARVIDHVLALLPFEPPYMEAAGMSCDFVGHPIAAHAPAGEVETTACRKEFGVEETDNVILVLPGSRVSEVTRLAPVFGEALRDIDARLVLPTTPNVAPLMADLTKDWSPRPIVIDPREHSTAKFAFLKHGAFGVAEAALAASGTVSLELAQARTPMVIAYDMHWLTRQIMRLAMRVDTVTLVNLVSETRAVPEFLGLNCRPGPIRAALDGIRTGSAQDQIAAMAATMARLGAGGPPPGERAARSVLSFLNR